MRRMTMGMNQVLARNSEHSSRILSLSTGSERNLVKHEPWKCGDSKYSCTWISLPPTCVPIRPLSCVGTSTHILRAVCRSFRACTSDCEASDGWYVRKRLSFSAVTAGSRRALAAANFGFPQACDGVSVLVCQKVFSWGKKDKMDYLLCWLLEADVDAWLTLMLGCSSSLEKFGLFERIYLFQMKALDHIQP